MTGLEQARCIDLALRIKSHRADRRTPLQLAAILRNWCCDERDPAVALRCLELAIDAKRAHAIAGDVLELARSYYDWISAPNKKTAPEPDKEHSPGFLAQAFGR